MGVLEILLLIAGAGIFALGFLLPTEQKAVDPETKKWIQKEVESAVSSEMEAIKTRLEEVTDESIQYAMEKTERSLERISNEKIMAVGEFSDTVLGEIEKSHKEAVFLYDMLSDKQQSLKNTVTEAQQQAKLLKELKPEEEPVSEPPKPKRTKKTEKKEETKTDAAEVKEEEFKTLNPPKAKEKKSTPKETAPQMTDKEKILAMHKEGLSDVEIAIAMGRGIGEIQLVIELFEGAKS